MDKGGRTKGTAECRNALKTPIYLSLVVAVVVALSASYTGIFSRVSQLDPLDYGERAKYLMKTTPLLDGHNDLPYLLRIELQNKIYDFRNSSFGMVGTQK